jgi:hypothetical protein
MSITDIVANIDRRLDELNSELAHLTEARAALGDAQTAAAPEPERPKRRARREPSTPRYEIAPAGKLIALLSDSDGLTTRQLAQAANADPAQVLTLLKEQESAGDVRRVGARAATRWHAITDEDRIAARVAELEAASRRGRARRT